MTVKILHVEDNPANRMLVRDLLEFHGYAVVEVFDGERALAIVEGERPNLILMDVELPDMSGLEVTRRIKTRPDLQRIPIIALTSIAGGESKAAAAGCDAYLGKPYRPRDLLQTIRRLLPPL